MNQVASYGSSGAEKNIEKPHADACGSEKVEEITSISMNFPYFESLVWNLSLRKPEIEMIQWTAKSPETSRNIQKHGSNVWKVSIYPMDFHGFLRRERAQGQHIDLEKVGDT